MREQTFAQARAQQTNDRVQHLNGASNQIMCGCVRDCVCLFVAHICVESLRLRWLCRLRRVEWVENGGGQTLGMHLTCAIIIIRIMLDRTWPSDAIDFRHVGIVQSPSPPSSSSLLRAIRPNHCEQKKAFTHFALVGYRFWFVCDRFFSVCAAWAHPHDENISMSSLFSNDEHVIVFFVCVPTSSSEVVFARNTRWMDYHSWRNVSYKN